MRTNDLVMGMLLASGVGAPPAMAFDFEYTLKAEGTVSPERPLTVRVRASGTEQFLNFEDTTMVVQASAQGGVLRDNEETFVFECPPPSFLLSWTVIDTSGDGHLREVSPTNDGRALLVRVLGEAPRHVFRATIEMTCRRTFEDTRPWTQDTTLTGTTSADSFPVVLGKYSGAGGRYGSGAHAHDPPVLGADHDLISVDPAHNLIRVNPFAEYEIVSVEPDDVRRFLVPIEDARVPGASTSRST